MYGYKRNSPFRENGVMVSIGLNKSITSPTPWFYIYDEDIWPARVYAPEFLMGVVLCRQNILFKI